MELPNRRLSDLRLADDVDTLLQRRRNRVILRFLDDEVVDLVESSHACNCASSVRASKGRLDRAAGYVSIRIGKPRR